MTLPRRLKAELRVAMNEGDAERISVARTLLAAIANAEAVELDASQPREVQGWAEVPRRHLTDADLTAIFRREADELVAAADDYGRRGRPDEAARLRARAALVEGFLAELG